MLEKAEKTLDAALRSAIDGLTASLKREVDARTPEDTGRLLSNNRAIPAETKSGTTSGRVENPTPYAVFVEYGTLGTSKNYHKPKGTVMRRGLGARMFTLAVDASKQKIKQTLSETVQKWASEQKK